MGGIGGKVGLEGGIDTTRFGGTGAEGSFGVCKGERGTGCDPGVLGMGESLLSESGSSVRPGGIAGEGEPETSVTSETVARLSGWPGAEPISVVAAAVGGGVGGLIPSAVRSRSTAW